MAFDSANLTTPDIKWLGVRPSDLNKFQIPEQCRLEMSQKDIETGHHMLKEGFIQQNPEWVSGDKNYAQVQDQSRNYKHLAVMASNIYPRFTYL